jgi:regulator of protease activity HflC (stomatin/prohibitin superfamily)
MMQNFPGWIVTGLFAALVGFVVTRFFTHVTVWQFEKGLKYRKGRFEELLEPGRYLIYWRTQQITRVDVRPQYTTIIGQEVLSADNIAVKVSLAVRYQVSDPVKAINETRDYMNALYLELQIALRCIVGSKLIDELLENRGSFDDLLLDKCRARAEEMGVTLEGVHVRDITFPGDLKKVFAQVVKARKEGLAALERARGETAALRSLANAARLLENNPTLLQLRMVQSLGESSGNTLVVGLPKADTVLPLKKGRAAAPAQEEPQESS